MNANKYEFYATSFHVAEWTSRMVIHLREGWEIVTPPFEHAHMVYVVFKRAKSPSP